MRLTGVLLGLMILVSGCSEDKPSDTQTSQRANTTQSDDDSVSHGVHFNVKEFTTPKGIRFWHVHLPDAPVVAFSLSVAKLGDAYDPEAKVGVGNFLAEMLEKGSVRLDEKKLQAFLEDHAAALSFQSDTDDFLISLSAVREDIDHVVETVGDLLRHPRFDANDFALAKEQQISSLAIRKGSMRYQMSKIVKKTLYAEHPYGRVLFDLPEEINRITVADLKQKLQGIHHGRVQGVVVGALSPQEASDHLDKLIPDVSFDYEDTSLSVPSYRIPAAETTPPIIIPEPVPQATVLMVLPGIKLKNKKALDFQILVEILNRRLWKEVREKKGLVYVVQAYASRFMKEGSLRIVLGTDKRQVSQAIGIVKEVLQGLSAEGINADELQTQVTKASDAHPMSFTTTTSTASVLRGYMMQGRDKSYVNTRHHKLAQMTLAQIHTRAQKYLNPDQMHVFIHGIPEN